MQHAEYWNDVVAWFGRVPRFHDCEVVSIDLRRSPQPSTVLVHAFLMTPKTDAQGYYVLEKHALVSFALSDVSEFELSEWNHQNVLESLTIKELKDGFRLVLDASFGVGGQISAAAISITIQPVAESDVDQTYLAGRVCMAR